MNEFLSRILLLHLLIVQFRRVCFLSLLFAYGEETDAIYKSKIYTNLDHNWI